MNNKIYITGAVDEEAYKKFIDDIDGIKNNKPINLILNSYGGDAISALAIATIMRVATSVNVYVYGQAASAAVIILAYGKKRFMSKEAWVMVHEDQASKLKGSVSSLEKDIRQFRRMENQWAQLLADRSKASVDTWVKMHKEEIWLDATQCLQLGLIEEIV